MRLKTLPFLLSTVAACFLLTACQHRNNTSNTDTVSLTESPSAPTELSLEFPESGTRGSDSVEPEIVEIDLTSYFGGHDASAVFYNAARGTYEIYNLEDARIQYSPCSTFKILSSLAALEYGIITTEDSLRQWSGEQFWNESWNNDISLPEAFKTSCIWYYRQLINEIGQDSMQTFVNTLEYGNQDISDWEGRLNKNNSNRALTGFWVESSLMISPIEQVDLLRRVFGYETDCNPQNIDTLKEIMKVEQTKTSVDIYGKTGYGKLNNLCLDAWFVGMFEVNSEANYFAVHFSETEDPAVTSALAKEIAIQIITDRCGG